MSTIEKYLVISRKMSLNFNYIEITLRVLYNRLYSELQIRFRKATVVRTQRKLGFENRLVTDTDRKTDT